MTLSSGAKIILIFSPVELCLLFQNYFQVIGREGGGGVGGGIVGRGRDCEADNNFQREYDP